MNNVSEFQLAEEVGSISTCPHRESELAARVAEHPSQSVYVHQILSSRQRRDYEQPPLSVSLQNLSVADLAPATRFRSFSLADIGSVFVEGIRLDPTALQGHRR